MIAVNVDRVSYTYVSESIFENLSWEIHDDRVVGLVGPNGGGKSTLLRLIAGELITDSGFLVRRKGLTVGYLEQHPQLGTGNTVFQEVLGASVEMARLETELERIESRLADPEVYGDENLLARVLAQQERVLEEYSRVGGPSYEGRVRSTLRSFGFSAVDQDLPVEVLSGGQIKLVGLAKLVITQPDLLLLDEPDNHLDLESKAFLERYIRSYTGAVVIVSHDRYLLDMVVDEIAELEDGRLVTFSGNYSEYAFEKQVGLLRQQQMYQAQQKEITRLEQSAKRLLLWGKIYDNEKFYKRGVNILKRIDRIDRIDRPVLERKRMGLELQGWVGSSKVLEIKGLCKWFSGQSGAEDVIIIAGIDLLIMRGERVGIVGPNGAGKSLLFRLILQQEQPNEGEIVLGPSVRTGYYAQQHETLSYERTLIDTVRLAGNMSEENAVAFLNRFLFGYEHSRNRVGTLSGGERSRLQMALLMLSGANFLMLDEPTNHLDIASAEVLEQAIGEFEGTVLVISHDRYFLDRVVDRIVELDEGRLTEYEGNYSDYQGEKRKGEIR
jgi:ATP-binding cassette, subfamily F, member 3